jgi:hypothetical protein
MVPASITLSRYQALQLPNLLPLQDSQVRSAGDKRSRSSGDGSE